MVNDLILDEFYKSVNDIFLFPGNLLELNGMFLNQYKIISTQYLSGLIIPSKKEISDLSTLLVAAHGDKFPQGFERELEEKIISLYENPTLLRLDLRQQIKDIGGDGLIHVRYHCENSLEINGESFKVTYHIGLPVVLDKS